MPASVHMQKLKYVPFRRQPGSQAKSDSAIIDHSNLDELFRQPTPHEFAATLEMRIADIVEDLQKRTDEEIRSWSSHSSWVHEAPEWSPSANLAKIPMQDGISKPLFYHGDMVSSPISLVSSPITNPNSVSVSRRKLKRQEQSGQTNPSSEIQTAGTKRRGIGSKSPKNSLSSPNKPSFPSFLKRVGKTPPLLSVTVHAPAALHSPESSRFSACSQMVLPGGSSDLNVRSPDRVASSISQPLSFSTALLKYSEKPKIVYKDLKRKSLPKDSPLRIPLAEHPVFTNCSRQGRIGCEIDDLIWEA